MINMIIPEPVCFYTRRYAELWLDQTVQIEKDKINSTFGKFRRFICNHRTLIIAYKRDPDLFEIFSISVHCADCGKIFFIDYSPVV